MADKHITPTQECLNELFEYRDGNFYWKKRTSNRINIGDKAGTLCDRGYIRVFVNGKGYKLHRLIFLMRYGYLPKIIDHIDGNTSNNKVENLREATQSQNLCNTKIRSDNSSGIKNVCWHKYKKQWYVQVQINGKAKSFGCYQDIELAELVAIMAREKYHKEFARVK